MTIGPNSVSNDRGYIPAHLIGYPRGLISDQLNKKFLIKLHLRVRIQMDTTLHRQLWRSIAHNVYLTTSSIKEIDSNNEN